MRASLSARSHRRKSCVIKNVNGRNESSIGIKTLLRGVMLNLCQCQEQQVDLSLLTEADTQMHLVDEAG